MGALVPRWPDDEDADMPDGWHPDGVLGGVADTGPAGSGLDFLLGDRKQGDTGVDATDHLTSSHADPNIAGKVWNLPNSLIGLGYGGLGYLAGWPAHWLGLQKEPPRITTGNNAVQFTDNPFGGVGAITLGNVEVFKPLPPNDKDWMERHERQHTYQGEQLGPLYLPSNILGGLSGELVDGEWHGPHNWNEVGPRQQPPVPWPK